MALLSGFARVAAAAAFGVVVSVAAGEPLRAPSPLKAAKPGVGSMANVLPVTLDRAAMDALKPEPEVLLAGLPLTAHRSVDLRLEQFQVYSPDARIVEGNLAGDLPMARPDAVLLRGSIDGEADSRVYLGLSPHGCNGFIQTGDSLYILAAGRDGAPMCIYDMRGPAGRSIRLRDAVCGGGLVAPGTPPVPGGAEPSREIGCRIVRVGVDGDFKYVTELFAGNGPAAQAYIATLFGGISEIYRRELSVTMQVAFARVWTTQDPFPPDSVGGTLLSGFGGYWDANMGDVQRNIAHLLTGNRPGGAGGIAWLANACGGSFAYGVSGFINGSFPSPLGNNNAQNWDLVVVAHEIGHNMNCLHTHEMAPPVDGCGTGDCSQAARGTIMSYCHTCSGGLANIALNFHQRNITEQMIPFINGFSGSCMASAACSSRIINIGSRTDCSAVNGSVSVLLQPGTWLFKAVNAAGGGAYNAWSPSANNSGCGATCCTAGWTWSYDYILNGVTTAVTAPGCFRSTDTGAFTALSQDRTVSVASNTVATFRVSDTGCSNNRGGVSMQVIRCPQVVASPGGQSWCSLPASVALSVTATGDDLSYQWRRNGVPIASGGRFSGATSPLLTISPPVVADAGAYDCVVTNVCSSVTSASAPLVLSNGGPEVTAQPQGFAAAPAGTAVLSVAASGLGSLGYQWRKNGEPITDGERISGSNEPTLTIAPLIGDDTGTYDVQVSDQCGIRVSVAATLIVQCPGDWNQDGAVTPADVAAFINTWSTELAGGGLTADSDGNGVLQPADVAVFVTTWFAGLGGNC